MDARTESRRSSGPPKLVSCRGKDCEAEFFWVDCIRRDGETGRVPLNTEAVTVEDPLDRDQLRGKFVYIDSAKVRAAVPGDRGPFFESHFHTCPNAADFRGGRT